MADLTLKTSLFDYSNLFFFIAAAAIAVPLILFGLGSFLGWILLGTAVFFAAAMIINTIVRSFYPNLKLDDYFETFALLLAAACGLPLMALGIGPLVSWVLIGATAFFVLVAVIHLVGRFSSDNKYQKLSTAEQEKSEAEKLIQNSYKAVFKSPSATNPQQKQEENKSKR